MQNFNSYLSPFLSTGRSDRDLGDLGDLGRGYAKFTELCSSVGSSAVRARTPRWCNIPRPRHFLRLYGQYRGDVSDACSLVLTSSLVHVCFSEYSLCDDSRASQNTCGNIRMV